MQEANNGSKNSSDVVQFAPLSLFPTVVSRKYFEDALTVQKDFSALYYLVANDYEFIKDCHSSVIKTDEFTRRLFDIYAKVISEGVAQKICLNVQRADYMFHVGSSAQSPGIKQVEVNNIAASFAGLDSKVTELHRHLLQTCGYSNHAVNLPENKASHTIALGLCRAWELLNVPNSVVLFLTEPVNRNVFDQRAIEEILLKLSDYKCKTKWLTLSEVSTELTLDEATKRLSFTKDSNCEVAVVYFRTAYIPQQFVTESEWKSRETIERSRSVKCPWIGFHLAGTKKVQQVLAQSGVLERYIKDPDSITRMRQTFMGLYGFDDSADNTAVDKIVEMALADPHSYVLKPQLEGGGNNFYGEQVAEQLRTLSPEQRGAFILMERIIPQKGNTYLLRPRQQLPIAVSESVSEMGTYGYLLGEIGNETNIIENQSGGHLLRTKAINVDEGGIMAGASVLDSPLLID